MKVEIGIIPDVEMVTDSYIEDVPIRIYNPNPKEKLPITIYFHGGALIGSVNFYDYIYRKLATELKQIIIAPEYRITQVFKFPAAENDAETVLLGVYDTLNKLGIKYMPTLTLGGDSIGGSIVAEVVSDLKKIDVMVDNLFLFYPGVDFQRNDIENKKISSSDYIDKKYIQWVFNSYFQQAFQKKKNGPLEKEIDSDFPRTFLITAENCPFKEEDFAYKEKLLKNNIEIEQYHFSKMNHGFMNLENLYPMEVNFAYRKLDDFLNNGNKW